MVNFRIVSKIIGQLLFLESAFMLFSLAVAFYYNEDDIMAFLISMIATVGSGLIFRYFGRNSTNNMSRRDAYFVVTYTWIIFSVFGMLPYIVGGYITNLYSECCHIS